jgi:hypothetical protein
MTPVTPTTVQENTLAVQKNALLDWDFVEPSYNAFAEFDAKLRQALLLQEARGTTSPCNGKTKAKAKPKTQAKAKAKTKPTPQPCYNAFAEFDAKVRQAKFLQEAPTPEVKPKAKAMKIPKCNLDTKWLESLAQEIATTTPKISAHLEAKAKAQAKAKAKQNPT